MKKAGVKKPKLISIVVPIYNEAANIPKIVSALSRATKNLAYKIEIILVNDGSSDASYQVMQKVAAKNKHIRPLHLARNFGKEVALTAGLHHAKGQAAIMLDADLQHPPRYIAQFIKKWEAGADVVVGVRTEHGKSSMIKHVGSKVFYRIIKKISKIPIVPHATDFRLLDRSVIDAYNTFTERNRIVRGLIDWLGFSRDYVYFKADERLHGHASYSTRKLFKLAADTFISMSFLPLRISGYLGAVIVVFSAPLGAFMFTNIYFMNNSMDFSGPASLSVLILFLVGVTLLNLGFVSLYIANIYDEVVNRPLYVLQRSRD